MGTLVFIAFIILLFWLLGILVDVAAGYIHLLLLVAVVLVLVALIENRRSGRKG